MKLAWLVKERGIFGQEEDEWSIVFDSPDYKRYTVIPIVYAELKPETHPETL
jgi:hypothetical protein